MKLNLGSGARNLKGYVNIDVIKRTDTTVVGDILNLEYEGGSVDEIFSEHVVEHLTKPELEIFFSECGRMLKLGGKLHIIAPCFVTYLNKYFNKERFYGDVRPEIVDIDVLDTILFGAHSHEYGFHKQGIYREKLQRLCIRYGFEVIKIYSQDRDHSANEIVLIAELRRS